MRAGRSSELSHAGIEHVSLIRDLSHLSHRRFTRGGYVAYTDEMETDVKRSTRWMAVLVVGGALFLRAGPASAEERACRGTIGAVTVDNLRVPHDATCTLNGTLVEGTIKVQRDATLKASGIHVIGNVQAENARMVVLRDRSTIGGSVQIVQGDAARIIRARIGGDILFDDQERSLAARGNRIGGNLQAFQNTGGLAINNNRIDGNLQCKKNDPAPTGGGNVVQGSKEDQCEGL